jgi:hypothetical protein
MMANRAANRSAEETMMTRVMARDATHYGAFDAALGFGRTGTHGYGKRQNWTSQNGFHVQHSSLSAALETTWPRPDAGALLMFAAL